MEIQTFAPFTVLRTHQPSDPDAPCSGQLSGFKERIDEARSSPVERHGQFIAPVFVSVVQPRSEEHTSELQSLMRNSYAVFCLKKKTTHHNIQLRTEPVRT